jgi:uncharacterized protein YciI
VEDHTGFMNALAAEGFVLFAGPLAGTESGRLRVLLIVDAESDDDIRDRLAEDPWAHRDRLVIRSIEPWNLIVGAERLASQCAARG